MLASLDQPVHVKLDGEPKGKGRPRFSRKMGVAFTPADTRKYEAALRYAAQEAMAGRDPILSPCRVTITAKMPIPTSWPKWRQEAARNGKLLCVGKPDVDNLMKVLDALNGVVFKDDSQIFSASVVKDYSDKPSLWIFVEPMRQAER
jgi:Holliday junction resolvase RusA-like endonuclease